MFCYHWPTGVGGAPGGSPGVTTLGVVRQTIRQRMDMVGDNHITDAEWNAYINSSYQELYDLLIQKYGADYYVATPYTFTTNGTLDLFPIPNDLYKLAAVEVQTQTNIYADIQRMPFAERNRGGVGSIPPVAGRTNLRYRLMGQNLMLRSGATAPSAGQTIRIWYAPRLNLLVNDGDTLDGVSGWDEYVIADCMIKGRSKREEDCSIEMALKAALKQRIEEAAENRDEGGPQVVADVRGGYPYPEFYTAGGWD